MAVRQQGLDRSIGIGAPKTGEATATTPSPRKEGKSTSPWVAAALVGVSVLFLIPFLWLLAASLKVRSEVFGPEFIPDPFAWSNYSQVWRIAPVLRWFFNSVLVGALAAGSVVISSALVAFGFAYFRFRGRGVLFGLVLATMMLPGAVTMIPTFLIWDYLGWTNTQVPLWAHNLFGSAFYTFMLRQFFLTIPRDLFEAARVDGANYLQVWWRIAMPLSKPALIVVALFEFKASWTDLLRPLIYLSDAAQFTLPLGLKTLLDQFGAHGIQAWELVLAASVISTIPMLVLFFIAQRHFVEGISTTGIK